MSEYATLKARLDAGDVIILDGAIGTQLQRMSVPMNNEAWCATALHSHVYTVREMHEAYIGAGVDIITTNTYSSARHNLEPLGMGDLTRELNVRAAMLALDARDRKAKDRPVYVAGSVSSFGITTGGEYGDGRIHRRNTGRSAITEAQARANLREQAEILAGAGVDFLLSESTNSTELRRWVIDACRATGLPVWLGFKYHLGDAGEALVGHRSDLPQAAEFEDVVAGGGDVVSVFHTSIAATDAALPHIQSHWSGPLCIYPEAERTDYTATVRDEGEETVVTPAQFVEQARAWVSQGVQIIGGCCGIELEYIAPLRDALPARLSA